MENKMFCYQCQETAGCTGCTQFGVCGKSPALSRMQDLLIYTTKGLSAVTTALRAQGEEISAEVNHYITINLFTTITNANFDDEIFYQRVFETLSIKNRLLENLKDTSSLPDAALWSADTREALDEKSLTVGVLRTENEDVRSLRELIVYGLKGLAAYMKHANELRYDNAEISAFMQKALAATLDDTLSIDDLIGLTLETGKFGVDGMALLDSANTGTYGNPEITKVNIGVGSRPGILISGHDLRDLEQLLEQTQGTGVDVYTHSEMLPAHYYPAFKKYKNFIGNYGNAWWKQKEEFESFRGPILMTTNCVVPPAASYKNRLFTTGATGITGCVHIERDENGIKDFTPIIELAKTCEPPIEIEQGEIIGGFAHNQVLQLADQIVEAVKSGAIKKFFVMAGCDGRQ
jgi:hydroxylamine reductase